MYPSAWSDPQWAIPVYCGQFWSVSDTGILLFGGGLACHGLFPFISAPPSILGLGYLSMAAKA